MKFRASSSRGGHFQLTSCVCRSVPPCRPAWLLEEREGEPGLCPWDASGFMLICGQLRMGKHPPLVRPWSSAIPTDTWKSCSGILSACKVGSARGKLREILQGWRREKIPILSLHLWTVTAAGWNLNLCAISQAFLTYMEYGTFPPTNISHSNSVFSLMSLDKKLIEQM